MLPLYDDNPLPGRPYVTWALMGICIVVYLFQLPLTGDALKEHFYAYGMVPLVVFGDAALPEGVARVPAWLTPLTSVFMHGDFMHLAGNMLYLWIFGDNVELCMGRVKFLAFYLLTGVIAAFSNALMDVSSFVPLIGASGAISGVLGAYIMLFPRANVQVFIFPFGLIAIPAMIVLGFYFVMDLFSGLTTSAGGGGVAFWAHVGGFVAGVLMVRFFKHAHVPLFARGHARAFQHLERPIPKHRGRQDGPLGHRPPPGEGPWGRRPDDD